MNKIIRGNKKQCGFTLMEAIVSLTLIAILSAVVLPNYTNIRSQFALLRDAYALAQNLRITQEMAISARKVEGSVPFSYGIHISTIEDNQGYLIYADINGDQQYVVNVDQIVEEVELNKGIVLQEIPTNFLSINFQGPDPITFISSGDNVVEIVLMLKENAQEFETVFINKAGLIYVE